MNRVSQSSELLLNLAVYGSTDYLVLGSHADNNKLSKKLTSNTTEFTRILQQSKGYANLFTDQYIDQLVEDILAIRKEYPNLLVASTNHDHDDDCDSDDKKSINTIQPNPNETTMTTIQSARLKLDEIFERIQCSINAHYDDYAMRREVLVSKKKLFDECQAPIDLEKFKESSGKIQQFIVTLSKLIPIYANLTLNTCPSLNKENIEHCTTTITNTTTTAATTTTTTQYFETIYKAVKNLERITLANEKLENGLKRITQFSNTVASGQRLASFKIKRVEVIMSVGGETTENCQNTVKGNQKQLVSCVIVIQRPFSTKH
ncbi:unnamed protein product [Schistosoma turkestanicum]|nr:unnamed protein product [Schistosoma turkestanicum]